MLANQQKKPLCVIDYEYSACRFCYSHGRTYKNFKTLHYYYKVHFGVSCWCCYVTGLIITEWWTIFFSNVKWCYIVSHYRQRREEKEEAKRRERDEELEQERLANMKAERERRAKEDWKKRQQQVLAHRKLEEELRKEQEKIEAELEAARLREEEGRIKAMEESERVAFLEKMRQEEDELRRKLEEQKQKEEEERRVQEEERRQREEALALLRQKQLQRHLFIAGILKESQYLALCQRLTKAFTFSYFDLIPWNHLQHLNPPPSPVRDLLRSVKENIPPTIMEEDEDLDE